MGHLLSQKTRGSPGQPIVSLHALTQTTHVSSQGHGKHGSSSFQTDNREQAWQFLSLLLFSHSRLLYMSDLTSSFVPHHLRYCLTVSGFYDSPQHYRKEKRMWATILLDQRTLHPWQRWPYQDRSGSELKGSHSELSFPGSKNSVSAMTNALGHTYQTWP